VSLVPDASQPPTSGGSSAAGGLIDFDQDDGEESVADSAKQSSTNPARKRKQAESEF
jgi:hypothetical protein